MAFETVASADALADGGAIQVTVGGLRVIVARRGEAVYAIEGRCPHMGLRLRPSEVDPDGVITCRFHGARFSLKDGTNVRAPLSDDWASGIPLGLGRIAAAVVPSACRPLRRLAAEIRDGQVRVDPAAAP